MKFPALFFIAGAIGMSACTTNASRNPSSQPGAMSVWSDQYGDNQVIFCDAKSAVVISDPNKCGQATAKGLACTELAGYFSEILQVTRVGNKIQFTTKANVVKHEAVNTSAGNYLVKILGNEPVKLVEGASKIDPAMLRYYCSGR